MADDLADVLSEFAQTMLTDFPIQGILDQLVKRIVGIMPVTAAGVTLISPGNEPRYVAASSPEALRFERLQTELGEGPCVAAYRSGKAISVPDLRASTQFGRFAARALDAGMAAVFTFPLRHGQARPLGALDLYRDEPGGLAPEVMKTAQTLADVASAYLINATAREELQAASDRSSEALLHDALTGLPNRTLMLERLSHAAQRVERSGAATALLYVDLDGFKAVNDAHGHQVGDELLVALAQRLSATLRPGDTLARLAGDEFAVLCEDVEGSAAVGEILARLHAQLDRPFRLSCGDVEVTASTGMVLTGAERISPEKLLHDADLAMYAHKRAKRASGQQDPRLRRRGVHDDLAKALTGAEERGELHLVYQPIVAAGDGRLLRLEALVRWTHPRRGPIAAKTLIGLAERSGQITELGRWVLERAVVEQQRWKAAHHEPLGVSVNVSAHQLVAPGFTDMVATTLEAHGVEAGQLTLELTEMAFAEDAEHVLVVLRRLKALGVRLSIDDFGTGHSALTYLKRQPLDEIKIDREFVADLGPDEETAVVIVAALIQLAHGLGMTVVCEGVETDAQYALVRDLGCDTCQGFYFARPQADVDLGTVVQLGANGRV